MPLTHWGRVRNTCINKQHDSDNGLPPFLVKPLPGTEFGHISLVKTSRKWAYQTLSKLSLMQGLFRVALLMFWCSEWKANWGHWLRWLQPTSSIITDAKLVDSNRDDFAGKYAYFGLDLCINIVLNLLWASQERQVLMFFMTLPFENRQGWRRLKPVMTSAPRLSWRHPCPIFKRLYLVI